MSGAVVIRKGCVAVPGRKLSVESASRRVWRWIGSAECGGGKVVGETNSIQGQSLLRDKGRVCPGVDRRRRTVVKADLVLIKRFRKHHDAAGIQQRLAVR